MKCMAQLVWVMGPSLCSVRLPVTAGPPARLGTSVHCQEGLMTLGLGREQRAV